MKKILSKTAAIISAAILSAATIPLTFISSAADENAVKVHFDFGTEDFTPGAKADMDNFNDFEVTKGYFKIPDGTFDREDYLFSGWTIDGVIGYPQGTTYTIPNGVEELTLKAVWADLTREDTYKITYDLTLDGEEVERPEWLRDRKRTPGLFYMPDYSMIMNEKALSRGFYLEDGTFLSFGTRIIVPEHDVTLRVAWSHKIKFIYEAGDVDRLNGNTTFICDQLEGGTTELQEADRFSRNGFNIVGWLNETDEQVYKPGQTVNVPGESVTYKAVWEPKKYNVVFKQGNGGTSIKVPGKTDEIITCPDPDITVNGKYFAGWKDPDGEIFEAGSDYRIKGAIPGAGILLEAIWLDEGQTLPDPSEALPEPTLLGDANEDGVVTIADATTILQYIGNRDKYALTPQGKSNGDCYDPGTGISALDALAIQKLDAKVLEKLPERS